MMKKIMAKLGIGAANVNLMLSKPEYTVEEHIKGKVHVKGGETEQNINRIDIEFWMQVHQENGTNMEHRVAIIPITTNFEIRANEEKIFDFTYVLPKGLPFSKTNVSYFFKTHLDIAAAIDNTDKDFIRVLPPKSFFDLLRGLEELGFREKHGSGKFDGYKQEFEMFPTGYLQGQVSEIEFQLAFEQDGLRLLLELDIPSYGREIELKKELFFTNEELNDTLSLGNTLKRIMDEMLQQRQSYHSNYNNQSHYNNQQQAYQEQHSSKKSMLPGAIGGFAAGAIGGLVVNEIMEEVFDEGIFETIENATEDFFEEIEDFFDGDDEE